MRTLAAIVTFLLLDLTPVAPLVCPHAWSRPGAPSTPLVMAAASSKAATTTTADAVSRRRLLQAAGLLTLSPWPRCAGAAELPPDLSGRIALVTGATGLALETGVELAKMGATVVIGCRDNAKGEAALAKIQAASGRDDCRQLPLDLASFKSVRECARIFTTQYQDLHILVNTAGLRLSPTAEVTYTEDGFESQMQVNHLGPFLLAGLLLTRLRRAAGGARFVTVSSAVHRDAPPRELEAELERWRRGGVKQGAGSKGSETAMVGAAEAYAKSKLAAVVFTREMQRRLLASGVLAASGGSNGSSGYGDVTTAVWEGDGIANGKVRGKMASAKGLISLASVPLLPPGGRGGYYDASGRLSISAISAAAEDEALANVLWKASEKAVGSPFLLQPAAENTNRDRSPVVPQISTGSESQSCLLTGVQCLSPQRDPLPSGVEDVTYFKGDSPGYKSYPPFKFH